MGTDVFPNPFNPAGILLHSFSGISGRESVSLSNGWSISRACDLRLEITCSIHMVAIQVSTPRIYCVQYYANFKKATAVTVHQNVRSGTTMMATLCVLQLALENV